MGARSGPAGRLTEPQSLTVASIVSRRTGRCSLLACGTGENRDGKRCLDSVCLVCG